MPGGNAASGGPLGAIMFVVVMMGLLAAMAIPAFAKVRQASQSAVCVNNQRQLASVLDAYRLEHGTAVRKWVDAVGPGKSLAVMPVCHLGGTYNASYVEGRGYRVTCTIPSHDSAARGAAAPVEVK